MTVKVYFVNHIDSKKLNHKIHNTIKKKNQCSVKLETTLKLKPITNTSFLTVDQTGFTRVLRR